MIKLKDILRNILKEFLAGQQMKLSVRGKKNMKRVCFQTGLSREKFTGAK